MTRSILISMFALALLLSACAGAATPAPAPAPASESVGKPVPVAGGAYTEITVSELQKMLENKDFTFVNVHIPFEGDIANTDLSIPFDEIEGTWQSSPRIKMLKSCSTAAVGG